MPETTPTEQATAALVVAQDQSQSIANVGGAYRLLALYHRAMMVAYFWDEDRFERHAKQMCEYINFGTLDQRRSR